jgi:DNA-binding transcriptional ArsR family regulator
VRSAIHHHGAGSDHLERRYAEEIAMTGADEQRGRAVDELAELYRKLSFGARSSIPYDEIDEILRRFWQASQPTSEQLEEITRKISESSMHWSTKGAAERRVLQILRESFQK